MNRNAAKLNLRSTFYDSPHGMNNVNNRSTAFDVAKLGAACMKDQRFCRIVRTPRFTVKRAENSLLIQKLLTAENGKNNAVIQAALVAQEGA